MPYLTPTDPGDLMQRCPIRGDACITRTLGSDGQPDTLNWDRADPEIHVSVELLDEISDEGRAFLEARYELGEPCPHPDQPNTFHARLTTDRGGDRRMTTTDPTGAWSGPWCGHIMSRADTRL